MGSHTADKQIKPKPAYVVLWGMFGGGIVVVAAVAIALVAGVVGSLRVEVVEDKGLSSVSPHMLREEPNDAAGVIYRRDAPGVVFVKALGTSEAPSASEMVRGETSSEENATGSGFEVDNKGIVITNWHVVAGARRVTVSLGGQNVFNAKVIAGDPTLDVAVLRIPTRGAKLTPLVLGDSSDVFVGAPVFAIGNPFGLERTLTTGVISALQRQILAPDGIYIRHALQTDAPINPGNSGGPLLNEHGEVIGIASQIVTAGSRGGNLGIAFAVPVNAAKTALARAGVAL